MTHERLPFSQLEKWFLLNALQTHRAGAEASWAWLKANWGRFGTDHTVTIIRYTTSCTSSLSTAAQLYDAEEFALSVEVGRVEMLDFCQYKKADDNFRTNTR